MSVIYDLDQDAPKGANNSLLRISIERKPGPTGPLSRRYLFNVGVIRANKVIRNARKDLKGINLKLRKKVDFRS